MLCSDVVVRSGERVLLLRVDLVFKVDASTVSLWTLLITRSVFYILVVKAQD